MGNHLDIKALLKPNENTVTLYKLVNGIADIQVDCNGIIKSSTEHLAEIKQQCGELSYLINRLIKDVALVLGYALNDNTEIKSPICHFFIIHGMSEAANELNLFGKICEHGIETKTWPCDFADFPKHSFLKLLTQIPMARTPNNSILSEFIESASGFIDCQAVNLRIFSEALVAAHATGEIEKYITGALEFNNQWIGFVEAIQYMHADATFDFNQQKAA